MMRLFDGVKVLMEAHHQSDVVPTQEVKSLGINHSNLPEDHD